MFATRRGSGVAIVTAMSVILSLASPAAQALQPNEGSLDHSWDTDGLRAFTATPLAPEEGAAVAVQPDGKTVIVGSASAAGKSVCLIARLKKDGSDDTSFNGVGTSKTVFLDNCSFNAVVIQPDGKILLAGVAYNNGDDETGIVARYTSNGDPDSSFGKNGFKQLSSPLGSVELYGLALQSDGNIVVAGEIAEPSSAELYAARVTSKGKIDTSFATNGVFARQFNTFGTNYSAFKSVALQPDGRIVLAGYSAKGTTVFALVRLKTNGALDSSFGGDGLLGVPFTADTADANAVAVTPSGNIVAAGIATPSYNEYALAEVDSHGVLVDTFGDHGTVTQQVGDGNASIAGMAVQRDGKLVLVGTSLNGTQNLMGFARYLPDGTPDPSFDGDGFYAPASAAALFGYAVTVGRDGKITGVGLAQDGTDPSLIGTVRLLGDTTAPTTASAKPPHVFTLGHKVTFHLASHDTNTGVAGFALARTRWPYGTTNAHGPTTLPVLGHAKTSLKAGKQGVNDCFTATPVDRAGNYGPPAYNLCTAYPVDDRKLSASAKWQKIKGKHYYRRTALTTHAKGQRLVLKGGVYGTLALFATTCKTCGKVTVSRGTTSLGSFDLSSPHTHARVQIDVDARTTVQTGKITITTTSRKLVTIDAIGLSLINT